MAGMLRKTMLYLGLAEGEDEQDYDEYGDESYDEASRAPARYPEPRRTPGAAARVAHEAPPSFTVTREETAPRITTLCPHTYNDARLIGEEFRGGTPVIMNLTEMEDGDAKRLVDFAAGLVFGLRGTIEKVTNKVFLLSPQNVRVSAEDKARIAEGGFFNQS